MVKCMLLWWTQSVNTETQRASCTGPRSKCGHCSPDGLVRVLASAKHGREPCFSVCWSSLWSRWSPFSRILSWRGPLIALAAATWKEVACGGLSWWRSELAVWVEALCALPAAPPPPSSGVSLLLEYRCMGEGSTRGLRDSFSNKINSKLTIHKKLSEFKK